MEETSMRCRVHRTSPIGLIELAGPLRRHSAPQLRETVMEVLANRPDAIVLDLEAFVDAEELSGSVFPALGRTVAGAADGELILAAADPGTRAAMRRASPLFVRMFDTCSQAMAAAARAPARRRVTRQLPADPYAARTARRVLEEVCTRWRMTALRESALVIVTELVTNAVDHVGAPIELCVTVRHGVLRIEVSDHSKVLPAPLDQVPHATQGNGLWLVEGLASQWGATPTTWGKTVWADLVMPVLPEIEIPAQRVKPYLN
ncbi:MAG TPA: ATP-binding protein [Pseudonocardiaceae bacterium]|nr:ATP-binding protein [Pseudonocardiaceae bacterium]